MTRLLAILGLVVAVACGDGGDARPATGPAGKVLEVTGEVQAQRGEQILTLAAGDVVNAEDIVITAEDAAVRIALDHNQAIWSLEGGERRAIRESAAWTAPEQQGGSALAGQTDDHTTAAGRHAEREAAETRSTAATEDSPAAAAAPGAAPAEPEPTAEPEVAQDPPPPPPKRVREKRDRSSGGSKGGGGLGLSGEGQGGGAAGPDGVADIGTVGRGGGAGTGSGYGGGGGSSKDKQASRVGLEVTSVEGGLDREIIRRVLRQNLNQVRYCYQQGLARNPALAGALTVRIAIAPDGAVSAVTIVEGAEKLSDAVTTCVAGKLRRLQYPDPEGDGIVLATVRFTFAAGER